MLDTKAFIDSVVKPELANKLCELSRLNVDPGASLEDRDKLVSLILDTNYFRTSINFNRAKSYDCHFRFRVNINNSNTIDMVSHYPFCFAPIISDKYFIAEVPLAKALRRDMYDEVIPSRDFSCHSYEWQYLYLSLMQRLP